MVPTNTKEVIPSTNLEKSTSNDGHGIPAPSPRSGVTPVHNRFSTLQEDEEIQETEPEETNGKELMILESSSEIEAALSDGAGTKDESKQGVPKPKSNLSSEDEREEDVEGKKRTTKKKNINIPQRITRSSKEADTLSTQL